MTQFDILSQSAEPQALLQLLDIAFGPGRVTRTAERLREGNRQISEYDRMAVTKTDGVLVGAISFWPIAIDETAGLLLGPLAVHPDMQGQGVGLALIQDALAAIDETRFAFTLLVGDLPYYQKCDFSVAPTSVKLPGPVCWCAVRPSCVQRSRAWFDARRNCASFSLNRGTLCPMKQPMH